MFPDEVLMMARNAIVMVFYLSMPIIIAATVVGLVVALIQTLIQVQEQTVAFAAKLAAVVLMLSISIGWMSSYLLGFLNQAMDKIIGI
ncbi:flagellar biosynthetic protein FliQ [Chelativorans sp. Marseille-P2723]|uniref:EscS/YscS/HrcS family type III secretion system export apparatus protein n=1 Tax=Chelativorans sp. Marseille-P2723 TaxID=2709133 RepID=UPI0015709D7D|nr:flagellar biosynthetic protein FliQ [Chelativorans sp. Marseille-P2723]